MQTSGPRFCSVLLSLCSIVTTICWSQGKSPCSIITKAEAEALLGARLQGPELSPGKTLCKYFEPGYGEVASKNKLVTIGVFYDNAPQPEALNQRRQFALQDKSLLPVSSREIPNFADAAIWVWAGGHFGALYAFKGGTLEVAVKISGISEQRALLSAKKFAARALGGTAGTGYKYAGTATLLSAHDFEAPGIIGPLYLGTFDPIADDEMTRNYVISLVQAFNHSCPSVPETEAIIDYGFYYVSKANKGVFSGAASNNISRGFEQAMEAMHRAKPHMLQLGYDDASHFLEMHRNGNECLTPPVEKLYRHIAALAQQRGNIPPDVDDYDHFLKALSLEAQRKYANGFEGLPSREEQKQLQRVKKGCLAFTKGAMSSMESFCRCHADAAKESKLNPSDLELLAAHFTQETLDQLSRRYRVYDGRKNACYQ